MLAGSSVKVSGWLAGIGVIWGEISGKETGESGRRAHKLVKVWSAGGCHHKVSLLLFTYERGSEG